MFDGIRDHLLQAAELKFNVFFLLPLVDAFPDALRNTTEAAWEGDVEVGKGGWGGGVRQGGNRGAGGRGRGGERGLGGGGRGGHQVQGEGGRRVCATGGGELCN